MKTLLITLFLLAGFTATPADIPRKDYTSGETAKVMICVSKGAKRYHNSNCQGIRNCKHETRKVTVREAKKMGLTPCGYCYK